MSGPSNTTIQDDNLTFLTYSPGWLTNTTDTRYDRSNFHAATQVGDTLTLSFQGTWLEVTGAKKPQYGPYSVELDGRLVLTNSSLSPTVAFRQTLFHLQDLPPGLHTLRMVNTGAGFDVDSFTFTSPPSTPSKKNQMNIAIGVVLAVIGLFALGLIIFLLRRLSRVKRESRGPYAGAFSDTATLVQVHPYDYVSPFDPTSEKAQPTVPLPAFVGDPASAPSTLKNSYAESRSDHSHSSLPYLANDQGRYRSETVTSQSSLSSTNTLNLAQQPPVTYSTPPVYVPPQTPIRTQRPLSIAGQPGSIRNSLYESPFDPRRVTALYSIQPSIREYTKRDTVFGKRSIDERPRIDLLSEGVSGSASAHRTEFVFPRPAPHPPTNSSTPTTSPPQSISARYQPPALTLNTTVARVLSAIAEPSVTPATDEDASSLSTIYFATRPNSGVTKAPSIVSRSNSNGESLFDPTSEKEKRLSTSTSIYSHKTRRRLSSVPPLPPVPEPEPEPIPCVPLAPPPPVATRHRRAAGSFGSMGSMIGVTIGTPKSGVFNSPTIKNQNQNLFGPPSSPRLIRGFSPSPLRSQTQALAPDLNATDSPQSKMRVVDLEAGVVGIVEEKRGWSKVRSMIGVMGDTNKDEALFEIVGRSPSSLSPVQEQAPGQGQGQEYGQHQWRTQVPRVALPGKVSGPRGRTVYKKPAPLALSGLSNFEPLASSRGNRTTQPVSETERGYGRKTLSILQSAVMHGRANKEEVELVTGMKMDI